MHHRSAMRAKVALLALAGVLFATGGAHADDYFGSDDGRVVYRLDKSRTKQQRLVIAGLAGGAVVFGGIGLLFHLDSRSASDRITEVGEHSGRTYTPEIDDQRSDALRSRNLAIAGYTIGGALVIASVVALLITEPGAELVTVGNEQQPSPVSIVPLPGGAVVGGTWSF
jgi:hypothetical protein